MQVDIVKAKIANLTKVLTFQTLSLVLLLFGPPKMSLAPYRSSRGSQFMDRDCNIVTSNFLKLYHKRQAMNLSILLLKLSVMVLTSKQLFIHPWCLLYVRFCLVFVRSQLLLLVLTRTSLHQEIQFRLFLTEQILAGKYWVEGTDAGGAVSVPPKLKQGAGAVARCTWHWLGCSQKCAQLLSTSCICSQWALHTLLCSILLHLLSNYYCYFYYCICSGSSRQMVCYWGIEGRVMVTQTCSIIGRMCQ